MVATEDRLSEHEIQQLKNRLYDHFERNNKNHEYRAKRAHQIADITFNQLWQVTLAFGLKCPFCDVPLAEIEELSFNHFQNIKVSGHTNGVVVFSCKADNTRLWQKHRDNVDKFLAELGKDTDDFYRRISDGLQADIDQNLRELDKPSCIDTAILTLADKLLVLVGENS